MTQALEMIAAAPQTAKVTKDEALAGLRAVFRIFAEWGVSDRDARILLGEPSKATFYRWKAGEVSAVPVDTVWRLGDILGIYKALHYLFMDADSRKSWIQKPNSAFAGQSALACMLAGAPADLTAIRRYLDAERGGW